MMARNQSYDVVVAITILFGVGGLIMGNVTPLDIASPTVGGDQGAGNCIWVKQLKPLQDMFCSLTIRPY